ALTLLNAEGEPQQGIEIRQNKYLNNRIEQDPRHVKRRIRPMLGFKSFRRAQTILAGIALVSMRRKGQYLQPEEKILSLAELFYRLTT
ncbi:DDE-type integrase/transposase/recombinase, partial [Xenorhabdus bovienii]